MAGLSIQAQITDTTNVAEVTEAEFAEMWGADYDNVIDASHAFASKVEDKSYALAA